MPQKICEKCNQPFKAAKNAIKFCSIKCAAEMRKLKVGPLSPSWKGGQFNVKNICVVCQNEFVSKYKSKRCLLHKRREGSDIHNYVERIEHHCVECNKITLVKPSQAAKVCCSVSCSNRRRNRTNNKSGTDIEQKVEKYLVDRNCIFEKQVNIQNIAVVDFLVGTTVIQVDGEYWHRMPGRPEHDAKQDVKMSELGYTIIRISDIEMKNEELPRLLLRKAIVASYGYTKIGWITNFVE